MAVVSSANAQEAGQPAASQTAETSAQSGAAADTPLQLGRYTFSGSGSFGYRFVDVNGSHAKYNELLNLQQGLRLLDAQFSLDTTEHGQGWFDRLWVTTQGLGGDPFPVIRASLRKPDQYELRLGYRAAQYIYDLPQTTLTPNRAWQDRRRFADADLHYAATRNLGLRFFYNRTERAGNELAMSPFFYLPLGLNVWEAFGRFDTIPWGIPLREQANLYGGGFDYHLAKTNIHAEQSYRTYNNPANLEGFGGFPVTLRGPATPVDNLIVRQWDALAAFNVRTTNLFVEQEVHDRLHLRGGYMFNLASGPTNLNGAVSQGPILLNYIGAGSTKLTTHTADFGFTWRVFQPVDFISDYRYQTYAQRGNQTIQAFRDDFPDPLDVVRDTTRWDFGIHTLDTVLAVVPHRDLSVRGGVRFTKQDVVRKLNDRTAPGTRRTWSYMPVFNAAWTPGGRFSLRGNFENRVVVDPYVRITSESTVGSKIRARLNLTDRWGIDNTWMFRNLSTDDIGFEAHVRSNGTNLWYQPIAQVGLQGGFSYASFSSRNSIRFLRGVPPLTGLLSTDQTIDRIYSLGVSLTPQSALTLGFTGQFIRSTGLGTFTGESSTYGPLTWPAWSAEIGYNTKGLGRVVFGWQRSYYHEDLFRATDYSATGFILRFERAF